VSVRPTIAKPWAKNTASVPLVVLPLVTVWLATEWPSWLFMWGLAFSIYAGLKWLTFADFSGPSESTVGRSLGYLLLWPGMDTKSFFAVGQAVEWPAWREWCLAIGEFVVGVILIVLAASLVHHHAVAAGWIGMAGIVFTLHFGLFHLLSVLWRQGGVHATPIMDWPILASSLSDFWGKRWNLAFRDLAHRYVYRPLIGRLGIVRTTMAVFLVSGLVHDAVISVPAGGGIGLPTLYFLFQGVGLLFERSRVGKRFGTRQGVTGRLFCAAVILGPIVLLFHRPFVERVVVPMFVAMESVWN
jgi:hypothetical protein